MNLEAHTAGWLRRQLLPALAEVVVYLLAMGIAFLVTYEISTRTGPSTRPPLPETLDLGSSEFTPLRLAAIPALATGRSIPRALAPAAPVVPTTAGGGEGTTSAPSPSAPAPPPTLELDSTGPTLEPASP